MYNFLFPKKWHQLKNIKILFGSTLSRLISLGPQIYAEVVYLLEFLKNDPADVIKDNTASKLVKLQESLLQFIREVTRHQRKKATHILVTMISPSERLCKPYALPVSCVPYRSLTAMEARTFISKIIFEMNKRIKKVQVPCISNGMKAYCLLFS